MNDTVQKLMGMVQAYASDYAHALMVTGVGGDPRSSHQALQDELNRLFTPLTDEQIESLVVWEGDPNAPYYNRVAHGHAIEAAHGITGEKSEQAT